MKDQSRDENERGVGVTNPLEGRVFVGVREIAGYYTRLEQGLLACGVEVNRIDLYGHPFHYGNVKPRSGICSVVNWLGTALSRLSGSVAGRLIRRVLLTLIQLMFFPWAAWRHRCFVFGWGDSLLPGNADLPILRGLGKKVVFVFHGSDSRPSYLDSAKVIDANGEGHAAERLAKSTRHQRRRVNRVSRYADWVIDNPLSAHFQPRPFVNWFRVGMPVNAASGVEKEESGTENPVPRLLHAPSQPVPKGTPALRRMLEELREEGFAFEYIEVSGRPHDEVVAELRGCDFVIDQLYSDTPLAGFASEAATFGKAALVGIHDLARVREAFPEAVMGAVCEPADMKNKLREFLANRERRLEAGSKAAEFIAEWSAEKVARRLVRILGEGPEETWIVRSQVHASRYGWGLEASSSREAIAALVAEFGDESLCLEDKPDLKALLLGRISGTPDPVKGRAGETRQTPSPVMGSR